MGSRATYIRRIGVSMVVGWLALVVLAAPGGLPADSMRPSADSLRLPVDTLRLFFAGDLMQHRAQLVAAKRADGTYDYRGCFDRVAPEIRKADLAVANLEVTLGGRPYGGYPSFSAPDEFVEAVRRAGFDVLLFANNHCLDRGNRGALRTLEVLDSVRVWHTGVFRNAEERLHRYPLLVERKGFRIAFLNYTYDTNGLRPTAPLVVNYIEREQMRKDVVKARLMRPDAIIACMHWGIEYELLPRRADRGLADFLLSMGVDHVIGGHPHVVQPLEVVEDSLSGERHLVAYSLGNFVSNMSARHTDGGMVVRLVLKKVDGRTRMVDCDYSYVWTSRPEVNGQGCFKVLPVWERDSVDNRLTVNEKGKMKRYVDGVRPVIEAHSKGIKEYFFSKFSDKMLAE